jgi:hypothetical protein
MKFKVILSLAVGAGIVTTFWGMPWHDPKIEVDALATAPRSEYGTARPTPTKRFVF